MFLDFIMVVNEVVNASIGAIEQAGQVALWLQALGIVIVLWIVFQIIVVWLNYRRWNAVKRIMDDVLRIEKKIDRMLTKRN